MEIHKFGGASVKDAEAIKNVGKIIKNKVSPPSLVVVSAINKTTNKLVSLWEKVGQGECIKELEEEIFSYHLMICDQILSQPTTCQENILQIRSEFNDFIDMINETSNKDYTYSRVVSYGEILSSWILFYFLRQEQQLDVDWIDSRRLITTTGGYKDCRVDWHKTGEWIKRGVQKDAAGSKLWITQGFIASDYEGHTTTLGREGSDFTAAIYAHALDAKAVTIWKDVPGVMSADPKLIDDPVTFHFISYKEAAEMTYYGATVIHPRTIKPLANKKIPLRVRSFIDMELEGTIIGDYRHEKYPPVYIFKKDQILLSFKVKDLTFINERNLVDICKTLDELRIKINLIQNSAVSVSICVDNEPSKIKSLLWRMQEHFDVLFNDGLQLITIKNQDEKSIRKIMEGKSILVESKNRADYQAIFTD